jgi:hypothetical protein
MSAMVQVKDSAMDISDCSGNGCVTVVAVPVIPVHSAGYFNLFKSCDAAELKKASQRFVF